MNKINNDDGEKSLSRDSIRDSIKSKGTLINISSQTTILGDKKFVQMMMQHIRLA